MKPDELTDVFRVNLRRRRESMGLTQRQLASAIGAYGPYISDLENGKKTPQMSTLARIAEALSVEPQALLSK